MPILPTMNRRHLLGGLAATGAAGFVPPVRAAAPAPPLPLSVSVPPPVLGPRMNFEQADKIMDELGLDAIVVGAGTNVYHATGLDLTATKMGHTPGVYALITRNQDQRLSLIAPSFLYYYTIAMDHRHSDFPAYLYLGPGKEIADAELSLDELPLYPDLEQAPLDFVESTRLGIIERAVRAEAARPNLKFALVNALKDTGVARGRIAADVPPVMRSVMDAAEEATVVSADDALRRIRPVKSDTGNYAHAVRRPSQRGCRSTGGSHRACWRRRAGTARHFLCGCSSAGYARRVHGHRPGQFAHLRGRAAGRAMLLHRLRQRIHGLSRRLRSRDLHRRAVQAHAEGVAIHRQVLGPCARKP